MILREGISELKFADAGKRYPTYSVLKLSNLFTEGIDFKVMNQDRVAAVSAAIANIGYDGIVAFDKTEPEYSTINQLHATYDNPTFVDLLVICAATADYQLNGNAQRFWASLEATVLDYGRLNSESDVRRILNEFMEEPVNSRLNQQKRDRLTRIFKNGFGKWFVNDGFSGAPLNVWEELADALETGLRKKTVVLAMKIYDIAFLIRTGTYLKFPYDVPIPCDLQVERVSRTAGIIRNKNPDKIMDAWGTVMEQVSEDLGRHVSLLRIDSIVWQAGQIIGQHEPNRQAARSALREHFEEVGLGPEEAATLAKELTTRM